MRGLCGFALGMLLITSGCKKAFDASLEPDEKPKIVPTTGNMTGGGGAIQSVRKAAGRTVNFAQLKDLHLAMSQAFLLDNRVWTIEEVKDYAKRENRQLAGLLDEEAIIPTGKNPIWAYTKWPQRAGNHYLINQGGVVDMTPDQLAQELKQQGTTPKLEK